MALYRRRFDFTTITDTRWRLVAKELILALLAPNHNAVVRLPWVRYCPARNASGRPSRTSRTSVTASSVSLTTSTTRTGRRADAVRDGPQRRDGPSVRGKVGESGFLLRKPATRAASDRGVVGRLSIGFPCRKVGTGRFQVC
ncbi:hypothetical protein BHQ23_33340 [Mycobacterium gordonae]|nr:hypothetical protein BHQ23_33340 [Mycobacterium gordonae]